MTDVEMRFWSSVRVGDGCWLWTASMRRGYGRFHLAGKYIGSHRMSWTFAHGQIPDGLWVLHRCDNPPRYRAGELQREISRAFGLAQATVSYIVRGVTWRHVP
jgi:hypothetical protein